MFFGSFQHRLNSKGQATVPCRFRAVIPEEEKEKGFYLVRGAPECLYMFTQKGIEEVHRHSCRAAGFDPEFRLMMNASVVAVDMDPQGRIAIPSDLRSAVGIEREVVFVGNGSRIELWSPERWEAFRAENAHAFEKRLGAVRSEIFEHEQED